MHNYNIILLLPESQNVKNSTAVLRNVTENFGAKILNNFEIREIELNERLTHSCIPMKFNELLAAKN